MHHLDEAQQATYFPADKLPLQLNWWHRQAIRDAADGFGGSAVWHQDVRWPSAWPPLAQVFALRDDGALPDTLIQEGLVYWGREPRLNQSADQTHIPHAGDHVGFTWVSV